MAKKDTMKALLNRGISDEAAALLLSKYNTLSAISAAGADALVELGLPEDEAWKAITINPAVHTGIGDRVGSLECGKDGDVVIWTANPLTTVGACAYVTVIDGKVVHSL